MLCLADSCRSLCGPARKGALPCGMHGWPEAEALHLQGSGALSCLPGSALTGAYSRD